jgi:phosphoribosylglycinamide formyltransferase-1
LYNLAVLISGSGSNLQAVIDAVENSTIPNARVALVVSSRENAFGLERAAKHGIVNMVIDRQDTKKLTDTLKAHNIDGVILAGYLTILSPELIEAYSGRIINIHPALLPLFGGKGFYGLKVHRAVLASGVKYTGATAHLVDCGVDTGAILVRGVLPILPDDTAESIQKRVLNIEHKVLVQAVKALVEGKIDELIKKPLTMNFE